MKFAGLLLLLVATGSAMPEEYDYDDTGLEEEEAALSTAVAVSPPEFNVKPKVFTPQIGETVHMPCTSDSKQSEVLIIEKQRFDKPLEDMLILAGEIFLLKDDRFSMNNNVYTIENVKKTDSGYYSCYYQFDGVRINVTHTLNVYFEPSIRPKQKTINVKKGEMATVDCRASGNPPPTVVWSKENERMPSGAEEEQGLSITFEDVDRHVDGTYLCTATNGVGSPAVAQRDIVVSYPPEIRTENEMVHTGNGDRVELVCIVHAYPAAEIVWSHNAAPVDADTRAEVHDGGHRHLLTIDSVSEQDFGHYSCQATNSLGVAVEDIALTDAPSAPAITSDPHSAEEMSYTLTWTTDSYYPITQYTLLYRKTKANDTTDEPGEWQKVKQELQEEEQQTKVKQNYRYTLDGLERATDYEAVLTVRNTVKPADQVEFSFSTRRETAGQQQKTSGGSRVSTAITFLPFVALVTAFTLPL